MSPHSTEASDAPRLLQRRSPDGGSERGFVGATGAGTLSDASLVTPGKAGQAVVSAVVLVREVSLVLQERSDGANLGGC